MSNPGTSVTHKDPKMSNPDMTVKPEPYLSNPGTTIQPESLSYTIPAIFSLSYSRHLEEGGITSFQPHQANKTTYKQESVELVYLILCTTVGQNGYGRYCVRKLVGCAQQSVRHASSTLSLVYRSFDQPDVVGMV
jgi:hypothetical protein